MHIQMVNGIGPTKVFGDDHLDKLATDWAESHNGWFYDGPGMTHTTAVKTWEIGRAHV